MNTVVPRDQFKPIIIGENLVVNYNSIRVQWLPVIHEMRCFYSFFRSFGRNFRCKRAIKFLRRLEETHLQFLDFKNLEILN